jgi:hypothetical protein
MPKTISDYLASKDQKSLDSCDRHLLETDNPDDEFYRLFIYKYRNDSAVKPYFEKYLKNNHLVMFDLVYKYNIWNDKKDEILMYGGGSGYGSSKLFTMRTRLIIELLIERYKIKSIMDISCGSFNWLPSVLCKYPEIRFLGTDASETIINTNIAKHSGTGFDWTFKVNDFSKSIPDDFDLIICRDSLQHCTTQCIYDTLINIRDSNCKWLLLTSYNDVLDDFHEIYPPDCFCVNFLIEPYNLVAEEIFDEESAVVAQVPNKYLLLIDIQKMKNMIFDRTKMVIE